MFSFSPRVHVCLRLWASVDCFSEVAATTEPQWSWEQERRGEEGEEEGGGVRLSRGKGQSLREKSVMGKIGGGEVGFNGPHTQLAADTQGRGDGGK